MDCSERKCPVTWVQDLVSTVRPSAFDVEVLRTDDRLGVSPLMHDNIREVDFVRKMLSMGLN